MSSAIISFIYLCCRLIAYCGSFQAGGASPLGFAMTQAYAPTQAAVAVLDEYIEYTLYGSGKASTAAGYGSAGKAGAKPPYKSLQMPEPNNGIRMTMFYYNQSYFPWNYTEVDECGDAGSLNYNWCMTEQQANFTYRGFNYPHHIASYYGMYRAARNHPKLKTRMPWEW